MLFIQVVWGVGAGQRHSIPVSSGRQAGETFEGSFSAVAKPIFASKSVNTHLKALTEIYTIHSFAQLESDVENDEKRFCTSLQSQKSFVKNLPKKLLDLLSFAKFWRHCC